MLPSTAAAWGRAIGRRGHKGNPGFRHLRSQLRVHLGDQGGIVIGNVRRIGHVVYFKGIGQQVVKFVLPGRLFVAWIKIHRVLVTGIPDGSDVTWFLDEILGVRRARIVVVIHKQNVVLYRDGGTVRVFDGVLNDRREVAALKIPLLAVRDVGEG